MAHGVTKMINSCDYCSEDCKHLNDCLETSYNEMLRRCNVDTQDKTETRPEVPQNAKEQGIGEGIGFQRLRRITGYLVGDVSRWNNGKYSELKDRVKHGTV